MNNDVEVEGRPRPLSTGLWTLFSWLRRDDRSVSSESLSSAGSDRTVASFAFLAPAHYQTARGPLVVPPPGPPTDSYKKRVHDRNLRRHHDRDLTLHRKYGLYKSEGTCNYDAFSLPPARRINGESGNRWDRDRRATSECFQRRLAHVPGKRRAPLPPVSASSAAHSASSTRRSTRKRPAPQPPVRLYKNTKENLKIVEVTTFVSQMSSNAYHDKSTLTNNDVTMGCKSEKYCKKDASNKDAKMKSEKSFLKQIFDSKKRNSNIDISSVKILPSISELDKQAAEIIETCKLKATEKNNGTHGNIGSQSSNQAESWFCIRCLRKHNSSIVNCAYCLAKQKVQSSVTVKDNRSAISKASNNYTQTEEAHKLEPSNRNGAEEKQKLKEMLKEMKDSLPKRQKNDIYHKIGTKTIAAPASFGRKSYSTETPTLRVGSITQDEKKTFNSAPSTSNTALKSVAEAMSSTHKPYPASAQAALVPQVISAYKKNLNNNLNLAVQFANNTDHAAQALVVDFQVQAKEPEKLPLKESVKPLEDKKSLHTPLKISSLLNPMYVPKNTVLGKPQLSKVVQLESKNEKQRSAEANTDKVNRTPETMSFPTSSTDVLAVPSTSKMSLLPVNIVKNENKQKNDMETCTKGELMLSQKDKPPMLKEDKNIVASIPYRNISELPTISKDQNLSNNTETQDQHTRRRDLINQLEKSIAEGNERAAADAAAKLAQLRLSCSVLSFSSQILSQPSTSSANFVDRKERKIEPNKIKSTANNESHHKIHKESQAVISNSDRERSPPNVLVSKEILINMSGANKVTASPVSKAESPKMIPVQKNKNADIQQRAQVAKKETPNNNDNNLITIAVLVEDREATRGPVQLRINRQALMRDLRREAETTLGLATHLQRWIIGRALCVNDNTTIISLAGIDFSAPFYLCVVESEMKDESVPQKTNVSAGSDKNTFQNKAGNVYTELVQLEQQALVPNAENFECEVCMEEYLPGQGVVLRECVHIFCKDCLSDVVRHCEEPDIPCPAMGCQGMLQEREIRALVSAQDYERWLARGLAAAESGTRNAFHCRTRDCKGWALCEPGVQRFPCPVCKCINCVPCQAIHDGANCEQHHAKRKQAAGKSTNINETDDGTRTLLNSLISKGEALECPECSAIITKKWGCDWVKCSACKTEICWVTRGRRWGPGGKGDTSGGCRCGVDGKRCHPSCGYCH